MRVLSDREVGSQPHIRFQSFEVEGSRAKTVIKYKVEGIEGVFILESISSEWWKVVDAKVTEH